MADGIYEARWMNTEFSVDQVMINQDGTVTFVDSVILALDRMRSNWKELKKLWYT